MRTRVLYVLLALWAVVSMSYYVMGAVALREEFFNSSQYAHAPFEFESDLETIKHVSPEQKRAGLAEGSVLHSINGKPYTGVMQFTRIVRHSKPGDSLRLGVATSRGQVKDVFIRLKPREGPGWSVGGYVALLLPVLGVPLLGLLVGYWVVAGRPWDLNAWLALLLLSFPETGFGNIDWSFWTGWTYPVLGVWYLLVQHFVFIALFWFGLSFPNRWRFDVRWPWVKWFFLGITLIMFCFGAEQVWLEHYSVSGLKLIYGNIKTVDLIDSSSKVLFLLLFLVALADKTINAPTPDAKRRVKVLAIGSALSLGPQVLIFTILPHFGIDPHHGQWFEVVVPLVALFPLTLAYVLVVQRAMDVRILLRMGTKYLLARATIVALEMALGAAVIFGFLLPMMQRKEHQTLDLVALVAVVAAVVSGFTMRNSFSSRAKHWLDRKFFREAYNSEVVLSELSEQTRTFVDKEPLIQTVSHRVSEILHVPYIAVWLRGSSVFHLQQAVGLDLHEPVLWHEESMTVQHLVRTNRPATVYHDRPEEWFEQTNDGERATLRSVHAELLLPLPGRDKLMGLMTLGPKMSEQPYTPTDLRVLQSLAAQTGLALEFSELALSLAKEAAHRERNNREIEIARDVQQRLFPQKLPQMAGLEFAGRCRAALGVGGDYYDLIELENGKLGMAIGDVSGKGISAALLMAGLRASLHGLILDGSGDLAKMMERINRLVFEASASNRYATFFFALLDPATREVHYVNAGHNAPMLVRGGSGQVERLEAGGTVVGLMPSVQYEAQSIKMSKGDLLLFYTDGISEAMNVEDEEWGEEAMLAAAKRVPGARADVVLRTMFEAADYFTGEAPQHDDMTLMVVRVE